MKFRLTNKPNRTLVRDRLSVSCPMCLNLMVCESETSYYRKSRCLICARIIDLSRIVTVEVLNYPVIMASLAFGTGHEHQDDPVCLVKGNYSTYGETLRMKKEVFESPCMVKGATVVLW